VKPVSRTTKLENVKNEKDLGSAFADFVQKDILTEDMENIKSKTVSRSINVKKDKNINPPEAELEKLQKSIPISGTEQPEKVQNKTESGSEESDIDQNKKSPKARIEKQSTPNSKTAKEDKVLSQIESEFAGKVQSKIESGSTVPDQPEKVPYQIESESIVDQESAKAEIGKSQKSRPVSRTERTEKVQDIESQYTDKKSEKAEIENSQMSKPTSKTEKLEKVQNQIESESSVADIDQDLRSPTAEINKLQKSGPVSRTEKPKMVQNKIESESTVADIDQDTKSENADIDNAQKSRSLSRTERPEKVQSKKESEYIDDDIDQSHKIKPTSRTDNKEKIQYIIEFETSLADIHQDQKSPKAEIEKSEKVEKIESEFTVANIDKQATPISRIEKAENGQSKIESICTVAGSDQDQKSAKAEIDGSHKSAPITEKEKPEKFESRTEITENVQQKIHSEFAVVDIDQDLKSPTAELKPVCSAEKLDVIQGKIESGFTVPNEQIKASTEINEHNTEKDLQEQGPSVGETNEVLKSRPESRTNKQDQIDSQQEQLSLIIDHIDISGTLMLSKTHIREELDESITSEENTEFPEPFQAKRADKTDIVESQERPGFKVANNDVAPKIISTSITNKADNMESQGKSKHEVDKIYHLEDSRPSSNAHEHSKMENSEEPGSADTEVDKASFSRGCYFEFSQTEPAEWIQPEEIDFDNEDELMIIIDTEQIAIEEETPELNPLGLLNYRPEPREGSISKDLQSSVEIPLSISENIQTLKDMVLEMDLDLNPELEAMQQLEMQYEEENGKDSRMSNLDRDSRPSSVSYENERNSQVGIPEIRVEGGIISRDVSTERNELEEVAFEESKSSTPCSRSILKSSNKINSFSEEDNISFEDDAEIINLSEADLNSGNLYLEKNNTFIKTFTSTVDFPQSEPAEWYPSDENEDELFIVLDSDTQLTEEDDSSAPYKNVHKQRPYSKERPSSRSSQASNQSLKVQSETDRKKSSSVVPELEIVEMPHFIRKKKEDLQDNLIQRKSDEFENSGQIDRADSPRPPSQNRPLSTGFTHLDDFERKLAAMESELEHEEIKQQEIHKNEKEPNLLTKIESMMDLSINNEFVFESINRDFENGAESKFVSKRRDDIPCKKLTDDGFYINQEEDLHNVDHSMIRDGEYTAEYNTDGSGCVSPGQSEARSKKVSFAANDERYEIERPGEVNTLGKKLFSFSPPKPMKKLPGKENKTEATNNVSQELITMEVPTLVAKKTNSKEPSPSPKGLLSSITGGRMGSQSPDTCRKESGSIFGNLLRKGRKGSRSGSRQSSVERSSQDLGSEEEGRTPSRTSDAGSDAGSENSLVLKLKKLTKRKPAKVQTADFDELFARGIALSAQLDSENNKDPFQSSNKENVNFTPFEVYSKDSAFQKTQELEGIGYAEKVQSFLEDQKQNPQITEDITNEKETSQLETKEEIQYRKPQSKEPSPSPTGFLSSITGGRIGSKSPEAKKRDGGSIFGSLLRQGRKDSKSGSRQSSVEKSSQDLTSEEEGRNSRTSDACSGVGSEKSIVMKLKKITKKKPPKVKTADFDELFSRGIARSAQLESESNKGPFKSIKKDNVDSPFHKTQEINPQITDDITITETKLPKDTKEEKLKSKKTMVISTSPSDKHASQETNKEHFIPDEQILSPFEVRKDLFIGKELPKTSDEHFLAKITQFVAKYEEDPVWPAIPVNEGVSQEKQKRSSQTHISEEVSLMKVPKSAHEMFDKFTEKSDVTHTRDFRSTSRSNIKLQEKILSIDQVEGQKNLTQETVMPSLPGKEIQNSQNNLLSRTKVNATTIRSSIPDEQEDKKSTIMSEADFLAKVTSFVAKYELEDEYTEKIWPAMPSEEITNKSIESKKSPNISTRLTKSPGKSYLDIESGTEWFSTSIEMESSEMGVPTDKTENKTKERPARNNNGRNSLSSGAELLRKHISLIGQENEDKRIINDQENFCKKADGILEKTCSPPPRQKLVPKDLKDNKVSGAPSSENQTPTIILKEEVTDKTEEKSMELPTVVIQTVNNQTDMEIPSKLKEEDTENPKLEKEMANQEFYRKLVTGLRSITTPEPEQAKEVADPDIYMKYSHHLGRAEFGSLRKKDSTQSSSSNLRYQSRDSVYNLPSRGLSRDASFDKINVKLASSRKASRQDSGDQMRGQSKVSDTSEALPDLETEEDLEPYLFSDRDGARSSSSAYSGNYGMRHREKPLSVGPSGEQVEIQQIESPVELISKKEEALKDVADHKKKIKEVKTRIQNGLMTVVGFGVMAYLTTLETMGGGQ